MQQTKLIRVDKIGSATANLGIPHLVSVTPKCQSAIGNVVVAKVISDNSTYNQLELPSGRLCKINRNDVIAGVLGERRALKGFVGNLPKKIEPGDRLHILNLGGVIGKCVDHYNDIGKAIEVEVLGLVVDEEATGTSKRPAILNIGKNAVPPLDHLEYSRPLIFVAGTCMNSGKTFAASQLIKHFTHEGYRVAAAKLSGIACLRDTLNMEDHGAVRTLSFLDCGYPSTVSVTNLASIAKAIIARLNETEPDVIVLELGDGIIGGYNVQVLFDDDELMQLVGAIVFCASDFVGAWGGQQLLEQRGLKIDVISGAVTDSLMGREFIKKELGIPAANAINGGDDLFQLVLTRLALNETTDFTEYHRLKNTLCESV
jgi:hypothetical protein